MSRKMIGRRLASARSAVAQWVRRLYGDGGAPPSPPAPRIFLRRRGERRLLEEERGQRASQLVRSSALCTPRAATCAPSSPADPRRRIYRDVLTPTRQVDDATRRRCCGERLVAIGLDVRCRSAASDGSAPRRPRTTPTRPPTSAICGPLFEIVASLARCAATAGRDRIRQRTSARRHRAVLLKGRQIVKLRLLASRPPAPRASRTPPPRPRPSAPSPRARGSPPRRQAARASLKLIGAERARRVRLVAEHQQRRAADARVAPQPADLGGGLGVAPRRRRRRRRAPPLLLLLPPHRRSGGRPPSQPLVAHPLLPADVVQREGRRLVREGVDVADADRRRGGRRVGAVLEPQQQRRLARAVEADQQHVDGGPRLQLRLQPRDSIPNGPLGLSARAAPFPPAAPRCGRWGRARRRRRQSAAGARATSAAGCAACARCRAACRRWRGDQRGGSTTRAGGPEARRRRRARRGRRRRPSPTGDAAPPPPSGGRARRPAAAARSTPWRRARRAASTSPTPPRRRPPRRAAAGRGKARRPRAARCSSAAVSPRKGAKPQSIVYSSAARRPRVGRRAVPLVLAPGTSHVSASGHV